MEDKKFNKEKSKHPYSKEFHCSNCGKDFTKHFEFGEIAHKGDCPWCGVSDEKLDRPTW